MRRAVAVVLVPLAVMVLAVSASLAYGLTVAYGAGTVGGGSWAFLVLVPAGVALLGTVGARNPVGRPRQRTSVLAVGVLVVSAATVSAAVAYGGSVHERNRQASTTACSTEDVTLLAALDAPGPRSEVMGDETGGCSVLLYGVPDEARATADVVASLERGGWPSATGEGNELVFRRGDAVLRLSAASDGKVTNVRLTLR